MASSMAPDEIRGLLEELAVRLDAADSLNTQRMRHQG